MGNMELIIIFKTRYGSQKMILWMILDDFVYASETHQTELKEMWMERTLNSNTLVYLTSVSDSSEVFPRSILKLKKGWRYSSVLGTH